MENIKKIITQLNNLDPEWQQKIRQSIKDDQNNDSEMNQLFIELCKSILDEIKTKNEETDIYKALGEDGKWIIKYIEPSIKGFKAFDCVRKLKETEAEALIDFLYDNVVVFYDPSFASSYKRFGIDSQEEFIELAKNLDAITRYYVTHQFSPKAIDEDILDDLKLNKKICVHISKKIHENFITIQNALILERLIQ